MTLTYDLIGRGWARAEISHGIIRYAMTVSYLSDALAEMTHAASLLLQGASEVRFSFEDEPGEHRCLISRQGEHEVRIQILWFEDLWSNLPDASGQPAFECACTIARFTGEILACLQRLLNEHGVVGYKTKWHAHEFPLEKMERLRTLIQLSKQASTMA